MLLVLWILRKDYLEIFILSDSSGLKGRGGYHFPFHREAYNSSRRTFCFISGKTQSKRPSSNALSAFLDPGHSRGSVPHPGSGDQSGCGKSKVDGGEAVKGQKRRRRAANAETHANTGGPGRAGPQAPALSAPCRSGRAGLTPARPPPSSRLTLLHLCLSHSPPPTLAFPGPGSFLSL